MDRLCAPACASLPSAVISDRDLWRAAMAMAKRYGADAMHEAAARADHMIEDGDMAGAAIWHRILDAIERLQAVRGSKRR
jgi:hypothetical protein